MSRQHELIQPFWWGSRLHCLSLLTCVMATSVFVADLSAKEIDFKVVSKVAGPGNVPTNVKNVTLFTKEQVFDVVWEDETSVEGLVWQRNTGQFTLLDPAREIYCQVNLPELVLLEELMRRKALGMKQFNMKQLLVAAAAPNFNPLWDEAEKQLTLSNPMIVYTARLTSPPEEECSIAYVQFCDATARLNASRPGKLPPQARLALNREFRIKKQVPQSIELRLQPSEEKPLALRSQHQYVWQLTEEDREQLELLRSWKNEFRQVELAKFRETGQLIR